MQENDRAPTMKFCPDSIVAVIADVCFDNWECQENRISRRETRFLLAKVPIPYDEDSAIPSASRMSRAYAISVSAPG